MNRKDIARAVKAVERHGVLLVYPLKNKADPTSLWHACYPRSEMKWAWDEGSDGRVAHVWHLRAALAKSKQVVYSKWLGGRATLFSKELFRAMLGSVRATGQELAGLSRASRTLLEILGDDSPQATRALREAAGLEGRAQETEYTAAMRALWDRLLIVAVGERDEGGFPSLAVGTTELLFEPLWNDAATLTAADEAILQKAIAESPAFGRAWARLMKRLSSGGAL